MIAFVINLYFIPVKKNISREKLSRREIYTCGGCIGREAAAQKTNVSFP